MGRHISSEARSCNCGRRIAGPAVRLARGDAGLGLPSYACQVMEWGFDGVLVNTAVSRAIDPVRMATAFAYATQAGRVAYLAGPMAVQDLAVASTPEIGKPFWDQVPSVRLERNSM